VEKYKDKHDVFATDTSMLVKIQEYIIRVTIWKEKEKLLESFLAFLLMGSISF